MSHQLTVVFSPIHLIPYVHLLNHLSRYTKQYIYVSTFHYHCQRAQTRGVATPLVILFYPSIQKVDTDELSIVFVLPLQFLEYLPVPLHSSAHLWLAFVEYDMLVQTIPPIARYLHCLHLAMLPVHRFSKFAQKWYGLEKEKLKRAKLAHRTPEKFTRVLNSL